MKIINVSEAKAQLSALIARIEDRGEDIIIGRNGKPLVRMTRYQAARPEHRLGFASGQIKIADDFDSWPDDIAKSLGILDEDPS